VFFRWFPSLGFARETREKKLRRKETKKEEKETERRKGNHLKKE
jgi:hypothetical protein